MVGNDTIFLEKDTLIHFDDLSEAEKNELRKKYPEGKTISIIREEKLGDKKVMITKNIEVDNTFYQELSKSLEVKITKVKIKGFVKFEDDGEIIINPYLEKDSIGKYYNQGIYYYKLKNRQSIKLWFNEISVSAVTIPIKYRFKGKNNLSEDFSTAINGNIFLGYSCGQTSFSHQEKVGNRSNTWKITGGLLFGASTVVLNQSNTSNDAFPLDKDSNITKGLGSIGIGVGFAFNKINFGVFAGSDYAIGDDSEKWNYNKKPWLGIAIGYSLLNF